MLCDLRLDHWSFIMYNKYLKLKNPKSIQIGKTVITRKDFQTSFFFLPTSSFRRRSFPSPILKRRSSFRSSSFLWRHWFSWRHWFRLQRGRFRCREPCCLKTSFRRLSYDVLKRRMTKSTNSNRRFYDVLKRHLNRSTNSSRLWSWRSLSKVFELQFRTVLSLSLRGRFSSRSPKASRGSKSKQRWRTRSLRKEDAEIEVENVNW